MADDKLREVMRKALRRQSRLSIRDQQVESVLTDLRDAGYMVLSREPTEAEIEAMARALCESRDGDPDSVIEPGPQPNWWFDKDDARAARSALVKAND